MTPLDGREALVPHRYPFLSTLALRQRMSRASRSSDQLASTSGCRARASNLYEGGRDSARQYSTSCGRDC